MDIGEAYLKRKPETFPGEAWRFAYGNRLTPLVGLIQAGTAGSRVSLCPLRIPA